MTHPPSLVPRLAPDPVQHPERKLIALRPVQHRARVQKRGRHHRAPVHVGRRVDVWCLPGAARRLEPPQRVPQDRPFVVARRVALPPQHVLARVVMHFPFSLDVVHVTYHVIRLLVFQCVAHFIGSPGPVVAVVAHPDVRVLRGVEHAALPVRQHLEHPVHDSPGDLSEQRVAQARVAVEIRVQQLRVVVRHLLEVRHDPALIDGVAVEPATDMVADPALRHRYSVDERWIVPHFEKMAYDNAELLHAYLNAYAAGGTPLFKDVAQGIVSWVLETLSDREQGAFYTSQDADVEFGDDGDYWTWTPDQLREALPDDAFQVARRVFDVAVPGEMEHDHEKNVLWWKEDPADAAEWRAP